MDAGPTKRRSDINPGEAVGSRIRGSWRVFRAGLHQAEWGGQPGPSSWVRAWEKGLRAPANQSQEGAPTSGSPLGVYTGKGLLSGPCYTLKGLPFRTPSTHYPCPHTLTRSPHLVWLKETPVCNLPLGQCSRLAPAECGVGAAPSPSFPSHLLSLTIWALKPQPWSCAVERPSLRAK